MAQKLEISGAGTLDLVDAPLEPLRRLRSIWPYGLILMEQSAEGARGGLVMQSGEQELCGSKFQPPDCDETAALRQFNMNRCLIAASLKTYAAAGFFGVLLPVAYMKEKAGGKWEAGVAYFAYPAVEDTPRLDPALDFPSDSETRRLAPGAFTLITPFVKTYVAAAKAVGVAPPPLIGVDVRTRLELGRIVLDFLVIGADILCLKTGVEAADPMWAFLAGSGVASVWHLPCVPAAVRAEDLPQARGMVRK